MTSEMWLCLFDERFELVFGSLECAESECISVTVHILRSNSLTSNPVGVGVVWYSCSK